MQCILKATYQAKNNPVIFCQFWSNHKLYRNYLISHAVIYWCLMILQIWRAKPRFLLVIHRPHFADCERRVECTELKCLQNEPLLPKAAHVYSRVAQNDRHHQSLTQRVKASTDNDGNVTTSLSRRAERRAVLVHRWPRPEWKNFDKRTLNLRPR